jgi:hypothetical protein
MRQAECGTAHDHMQMRSNGIWPMEGYDGLICTEASTVSNLRSLSVVQTSLWLGEIPPSLAIPNLWACSHSVTLRPATTRHTSIYNGALDVAGLSKSCIPSTL